MKFGFVHRGLPVPFPHVADCVDQAVGHLAVKIRVGQHSFFGWVRKEGGLNQNSRHLSALQHDEIRLLHAAVADGQKKVGAFHLLLSLFRRHGIVVFLLFVLLVKAGDSIANPLFRLYLKDAKLTLGQINWAMNLGGIVATLLGSAICGFIIMRIGRRLALIINFFLPGAGLILRGATLTGTILFGIFLFCLLNVFWGDSLAPSARVLDVQAPIRVTQVLGAIAFLVYAWGTAAVIRRR